MLSYLIIVTLFNFKITNGVENDSTFINSLPQKQKEDFLKKVEARIQNEVPEIKFPKENDTDVDLYEKRLEDQGKDIQNILRSEIDSLKRRNINDTLIQSDQRSNDNHESDPYIDLTVRRQKDVGHAAVTQIESKRQPRKASLPEDESSNKDVNQIHVAVEYDINNSEEKRNLSSSNSNFTNQKPEDDEIRWESTNLATKAVNVNTSLIDLIKTGRRSDNINTTVNIFEDKELDKNNVTSTEAVNETSKGNIDATLYDKNKSQQNVNKQALNVNISSVDFSKTDRRSDNIAVIMKKNRDKKRKVKSVEAINDIPAASIHATSYHTNTSKSQENVNKTNNANDGNSKNNDKHSRQLESLHVMSSAVPSRFNVTSKTGDVNLTKNGVDVSTTVSDVNHNSDEIFSVTNNVERYTTPDSEAEIDTDPNKQTSDNKDNGNQPHYVPIHNYDPENAYFNAYNYQGPSGNVDRGTRNKTTNIEIDTHAKSTNVDFYSLSPSSTNSRIKDVKKNDFASNTKIIVNSDLNDVIFRDTFSNLFNGRIKSFDMESSEDDIQYEKPLKHSLNTIRKILFKHKTGLDKPGDNRSDPGNIKKKDDDNVLKKRLDTFGGNFKSLVDRAGNYYTPFIENKKEPNEDELDSDGKVYNDVIRSLKEHNKKIQNNDIHQIIITLEWIQNDMNKNKLKHRIVKPDSKNYQSRFQVKNREERKPTLSSIEEDIRNEPFTIIDETKYEKGNINKYKNLKIDDKYLALHASILKDFVEQNDVGLEKYDWLGTTVKVQAAIAKLQDIIKKTKNRVKVHYLDHRLLELIIKLHKSSVETFIERENEHDLATRTLSFPIPRPKNGKSFNTLQRVFGSNRIMRRRSRTDIEDFERTLDCFKSCLNDLHMAIKQISLVTTFKNQHWFQNLKQLYLKSAGEKEYLEVLLHLVSAKLIRILERTAKTIFEEDEDFLKKNRAIYEVIEMEFVTLIKICNELLRLNN